MHNGTLDGTAAAYVWNALLLFTLNYDYLNVCGSHMIEVTHTHHSSGGPTLFLMSPKSNIWNYTTEKTELNKWWNCGFFFPEKKLVEVRWLNVWFSNFFSAWTKLKVNKTMIMQNKHHRENKFKIQIWHINATLRILCDMNGANFITFLHNLNMINTTWQKECLRESCFLVTSNAYKLLITASTNKTQAWKRQYSYRK